jgi:hypothetical protein
MNSPGGDLIALHVSVVIYHKLTYNLRFLLGNPQRTRKNPQEPTTNPRETSEKPARNPQETRNNPLNLRVTHLPKIF